MAKGRPVAVIDVGAGFGDSILLLEANCPGEMGRFLCIEGDPEFYQYLQLNLRNLENGTLISALLSSSEKSERELIRILPNTASAQGENLVRAVTLDSLVFQEQLESIDLLKIDVDGLDGQVLLGSKRILETFHPVVIFEWHPIACSQTENNWIDAFEILLAMHYSNFVWFNKYGEFSHFMAGLDRQSIDSLAELCLRNRHVDDWHYDVIALPEHSEINPLVLAEMAFAKARKSRY